MDTNVGDLTNGRTTAGVTLGDVTLGACRLIHGTAEAVLPTMPDASVQLIITDPPYFRHKLMHMGERVEWDRQWKTREAYLAWLRQLALEWRRVLTPNGSLYCFASPQMAAHVEVMLGDLFHVIQRLTWRKPPFATKAEMFDKDASRMFFPVSEAIIFAEQYAGDDRAKDASGFWEAERTLKTSLFSAPILEAMQGTHTSAKDVTEAIGAYGKVNHGGAVSNWLQGYNIPTREHYEAMRRFFNSRNGCTDYLRQEYEDLRQEYEDLRRPFILSQSMPYTDVLDFATVRAEPGKHECEKPVPLLRHLILVSSRPGDTVLDCTMGRGSTLDAARQCGRTAIGIEQDIRWWRAARRRLSQEELFAVQTAEEQRYQPTAQTVRHALQGAGVAPVQTTLRDAAWPTRAATEAASPYTFQP
jgi:adenine-specific DNA-methyltransferase